MSNLPRQQLQNVPGVHGCGRGPARPRHGEGRDDAGERGHGQRVGRGHEGRGHPLLGQLGLLVGPGPGAGLLHLLLGDGEAGQGEGRVPPRGQHRQRPRREPRLPHILRPPPLGCLVPVLLPIILTTTTTTTILLVVVVVVVVVEGLGAAAAGAEPLGGRTWFPLLTMTHESNLSRIMFNVGSVLASTLQA